MNVALTQGWTQEAFFAWAGRREGRYEFDGVRPVAVTGGNAVHSGLHRNILVALSVRLQGGPCQALGPDAGIGTVAGAVRYPDVLVTCSAFKGTDRLIPGVVVVFEVISPSSETIDRLIKLREYAAVASIRRYVIVESTTQGVLVFSRREGEAAWTAAALTQGEVLELPEIGAALPLDEIYARVDIAAEPDGLGG